MSEVLDTIELSEGYVIEIVGDDAESPRDSEENLGHMYTWGRSFCSPDANPYEDEEEFVRDMLRDRFSHDELKAAVEAGTFSSLRFNDGHLEARYASMITGRTGWDIVQDYEEWQDAEELAAAIACCAEAPQLLMDKLIIMTVYRFEHSAVAYSTKSFGDRWDSGAVGFIWCETSKAAEWFGASEDPADLRRRAMRWMDYEVERYSQWANGEVYGVVLSKDDVQIDSVWNVYEDELEEAIEDMKQSVAA